MQTLIDEKRTQLTEKKRNLQQWKRKRNGNVVDAGRRERPTVFPETHLKFNKLFVCIKESWKANIGCYIIISSILGVLNF